MRPRLPLAALPCSSSVCDVHAAIGFAVVGGFLVFFLWGLVAIILRRDPAAGFWRLLAVMQVTIIVQVLAGLVLLATGHRNVVLHYFYGAIFPGAVLAVAHVLGRGMPDQRDALKVFTVAGFILFGLTLRALATGLGLA